ncbi:MAG: phosphatase [Ruminococcus sp.]|jgi:putative hydrolase
MINLRKSLREGGIYIITLTADIHMHTLVSGHAYGTIREMMHAAKEKGLKLIGISEHGPGIPAAMDPFYFLNLQVIPRVIEGVELIHGCEVNVLNGGRLSLEQKYMDHLDYAIVGIHKECYENEDREKNTRNVIECMKNEKVHFVSHPDDDHTPLDYEMLVLAAKEYQVALELNNSSLVKKDRRLNCYENYRTMLALCEKHQVPIIVSSDAHDPAWVGEFTLARRLLEETGFDETLILNTSPDKVKQFIKVR